MSFLRSLFFWVFIVLWTLFYAPFVIYQARWGKENAGHFAARRWRKVVEWAVVRILNIRFVVEGLENIPDSPFVLLSKHQSAWETLFVQDFVPQNRFCVFILKKELLRIPLVGQAFTALNMIAINRQNAQKSLNEMLTEGKNRLENNFVVVIFPEGTRTAPGTQGRYKAGGAQLAIHAQVPVVPVAHNAGVFWPRNRFLKKSGTVQVKIGKAIDSKNFSAHDLNQEVEKWIENEMSHLPIE